jgi:hypothetical protein
MRLPNHVTSHQGARKIEVRYDPEQLSAPYDKRREADDSPPRTPSFIPPQPFSGLRRGVLGLIIGTR